MTGNAAFQLYQAVVKATEKDIGQKVELFPMQKKDFLRRWALKSEKQKQKFFTELHQFLENPERIRNEAKQILEGVATGRHQINPELLERLKNSPFTKKNLE